VIESQINLCCWILHALITLSLMLFELSSVMLFKILSISSLGISSTISILSKSGQEILDWYLLISICEHAQAFSGSL
jgi:hypothetical protein